ncbi:hypothetical protein MASR1M90_00650 [Desulfovibrionales bacterium]
MPAAFFDRLTPRTSPRTQLLTAACVWTGMGCLLFLKGAYFSHSVAFPTRIIFCGAGIALGLAKSRLVFDRAARAIIRRIRQKAVPTCLGGLFSVRNWALIGLMMLLGKAMVWVSVPLEWKALVSLLVGSGLAYSSRLMWAAWKISSHWGIGDLRL